MAILCLCSADIKQLLYLKYCIKESMRLFPPVSGLGRVLDKDTNIAGYVMPKGTAVACQFYSVHRHPDFWENPDVCGLPTSHTVKDLIAVSFIILGV